ncbi:MAG: hypothetical protein ACD_79C01493G0001 [uncultured bacterium]|nr:MAG: hypothetical protein ACD_79C01493G0001 [uncultured bacterium]
MEVIPKKSVIRENLTSIIIVFIMFSSGFLYLRNWEASLAKIEQELKLKELSLVSVESLQKKVDLYLKEYSDLPICVKEEGSLRTYDISEEAQKKKYKASALLDVIEAEAKGLNNTGFIDFAIKQREQKSL